MNERLADFLKQSGIRHQTSVPYSPEQNGVAERLNRMLVERARSMLLEANCSTDLWAEAINTAVYLKNRSPTKALKNSTPEEEWTGKKPNLSHLHIFGCKAMIKIPDNRRKKWDRKAQEYLFVGYCEDTKGYRLVHPITKKLTRSRDVIFFESQFSNESSTDPFYNFYDQNVSVEMQPFDTDQSSTVIEETKVEVGQIKDTSVISESDKLDVPVSLESSEVDAEKDDQDDDIDARPRRNCVQNRSIFNDDYIVYQALLCKQTYLFTVEEALKSSNAEEWKHAMDEEIQAHIKNKTWTITPVPKGRKANKSKWVYKTKLTTDSKIERY